MSLRLSVLKNMDAPYVVSTVFTRYNFKVCVRKKDHTSHNTMVKNCHLTAVYARLII